MQNVSNALHIISDIAPKTYECIKPSGVTEYGIIAQELLKIYTQAVSGSPDSDVNKDPMMVDYSRITPLLTAGVKELNDKVKILSEENKKLKAQLSKYESLEKRLETLEQKK